MRIKWILLVALVILLSCGKSEPKPEESFIGKSSQLPRKKKNIPPIVKQQKISPLSFTEGIYISAWMAATKKFPAILDSAQAAGLNTVVFDLKNENGDVFFAFPEEFESTEHLKPFINIQKMVEKLHKRNFRAATRLVLFHDQYVAEIKPEWRPKDKNGTLWRERKRGKISWLDSSHPEVQKRLLQIIEHVAKSGVDEIQLDYVRFPTQGKLDEAVFYFEEREKAKAKQDSTYIMKTKVDIIADFVSKAQTICKQYDVTLTADIFAIVAWQRKIDVHATGQDIPRISKSFYALHPMVYSSHFARNFNHRSDVWNEPYTIVYKASKLTKQYAEASCKTIPYIQANSWQVHYSPDYIYAQIEAIRHAGGDGYILWNSSNKYMQTLRWIREYKEKR